MKGVEKMIEKTKENIVQILNIISFIAVITVNALANILPLNDYATGEVSALFPNLFTPASITFYIWILIYFLLGAFVIYQAKGLFRKKQINFDLLNKIGYLFIISSLANIGWIFAWHYLQIKLSFIIMLLLLTSLLLIYKRLEDSQQENNKIENYFVYLPFSFYTAWITVATLSNLTVLLVDIGWYGKIIPKVPWTIGMILTATVAGIYFISKQKDMSYSLVIIWALLGILIKRLFIAQEVILSIVITALIGIGIIVVKIFQNKKVT